MHEVNRIIRNGEAVRDAAHVRPIENHAALPRAIPESRVYAAPLRRWKIIRVDRPASAGKVKWELTRVASAAASDFPSEQHTPQKATAQFRRAMRETTTKLVLRQAAWASSRTVSRSSYYRSEAPSTNRRTARKTCPTMQHKIAQVIPAHQPAKTSVGKCTPR